MQRHREAVWRVCWRYAKGDRAKCENMVQEVCSTTVTPQFLLP